MVLEYTVRKDHSLIISLTGMVLPGTGLAEYLLLFPEQLEEYESKHHLHQLAKLLVKKKPDKETVDSYVSPLKYLSICIALSF